MKGNMGDKVELVIGASIVVVTVGVGLFKIIGSTAGKIGSNRDLIDTEKSFNIVLEKTPLSVSVVKIKNYSDYVGDTIEFETEDGLRILTSSLNCTIDRKNSFNDAMYDAKLLANGDSSKVISYDILQGNDTEIDPKGWNKRLANFDYNFDKAVILEEDGTIVVYDIQAWKDWEDDDKVQITLKDGNVKLTNYKKLRLIDTTKAKKGALESYLTSLIMEQENIQYYDRKSMEEKPKAMSKFLKYLKN